MRRDQRGNQGSGEVERPEDAAARDAAAAPRDRAHADAVDRRGARADRPRDRAAPPFAPFERGLMRTLAVTLLLLLPTASFSQGLEPGEWEFNAATTSPLVTGTQYSVFKRCIRKEDAENPERWMARQSEAGPCQLKPLGRTADSMKWEVSSPKTNLRGKGVC